MAKVARDRTGRPRYQGTLSVKSFEFERKLGEGTFGQVFQARTIRQPTSAQVALKRIIVHPKADGFPLTSLREIKILKMLNHENVLNLEGMTLEWAKERSMKAVMYMITPYMEHDLTGLLENPNVHLNVPQIKCYMLQLLQGVRYLHCNHILHRDIKASNLLINNKGVLQIADFGLARRYFEPPPPEEGNGKPGREYTAVVVTRWYRPPELLLQLRRYTPAIDMWGVGCVFAEMFVGKPIMPGQSDAEQLELIFDLLGSPNNENMPGWSSLPGCEGITSFKTRGSTLEKRFGSQGPQFLSLLSQLLKLDWNTRFNATQAMNHPYFKTEPRPSLRCEIPSFEESHELDQSIANQRRMQRAENARPGQNRPPSPRARMDAPNPHRPYAGHAGGDRFASRGPHDSRAPGGYPSWGGGGQRYGPGFGPPPPPPPPRYENGRQPVWHHGNSARPNDYLGGGQGRRGWAHERDGAGSWNRPGGERRGPHGGRPPRGDTYIPHYGPPDPAMPPRARDEGRFNPHYDRSRGPPHPRALAEQAKHDGSRRRSLSPVNRERSADTARERERDFWRR